MKVLKEILQQANSTSLPLYEAGGAYDWKTLRISICRAFADLLKKRGRTPIWDDVTNYLTCYLAKWYMGETTDPLPDCYSLYKGWLIRGNVGVGKTKLLRAFQIAVHTDFTSYDFADGWRSIDFIHALDLQSAYIEQNVELIRRLKNAPLLIIDDVGVELTEVLYYGNHIMPFVDLYDKRYRDDRATILTTNLLPDSLKDKYGLRIYDRLRECSNDFVFSGISKR